MTIIERLRKLGILRFGTKSHTYIGGKDMLAEALMDDLYDAKKDLVSSEKKPKKKKA